MGDEGASGRGTALEDDSWVTGSIDPLLRRSKLTRTDDWADQDLHDEPPREARHPRVARERRSSGATVRRAWLRRIAMVVIVPLVPLTWSYANALTGPGTDSFQARTVEWGRDHHLGWAVDRLEKWWFANHQAAVGGTPNLANGPSVITEPARVATSDPGATDAIDAADAVDAPVATDGATSNTDASAADPGTTAPLPFVAGHLQPPDALVSPASPAVSGEGKWKPLGPKVAGVQGAYVTSIRPDAVHTSILDAVVWFDPTVVDFRQYPGTKIPGAPWDRPDSVEPDRQSSLIAAFSGGFRIQDSHGGIILGGRTLQGMRVGGATFAIDKNGKPNIGAWGVDIAPSSSLDSARQSLDPIVINGAPAPDLSTDANRKWGFTGPANKTAVWRSGAGVRADGSVVWVGGNGLSIEALAETLVRAGVIRGMQLDINQEWVQFNTYATVGSRTHGRPLLSGMEHPGDRWLTEDTRDFIAVFTRNA